MTKSGLNLLAGIFLTLTGIAMTVLGAYWITLHLDDVKYFVTSAAQAAPVSSPMENIRACENNLRTMGFTTQMQGRDVHATLSQFPEPETGLALSSLAMYACEPLTVTDYCLGDGCDHHVQMTFSAH